MFQVKICGVTSPSDARAIARMGADALGLNFFPESRRFIDVSTARAIVDELPSGCIKVGLFVNASHDQISKIAQEIPLDLIQLHGDETPAFAQKISLPTMKAFRVGDGGLAPLVDFLSECRELGRLPDLCLLDALQPGAYGGTGKQLDWKKLATEMGALTRQPTLKGVTIPPVILSGGLNSSNVAAFVAKPFSILELEQTIRSVLKG